MHYDTISKGILNCNEKNNTCLYEVGQSGNGKIMTVTVAF